MNESEEVLVRNARGGDRAAFEELVRRTSRLVLARLYLETGDLHRAEDLLQETLLTAFRSLGQLTEPKAFRTWILKIAQNVLTDAVRREQRQKRAGPQAGPSALGLSNGSLRGLLHRGLRLLQERLPAELRAPH
jgi:RNA polymerase sigma-70 factor (ECF subfamily)